MNHNVEILFDVIKEAKYKIDKPQYIEGNNSYFVHYLKEKNGRIYWTTEEFFEFEKAKEFYLTKLRSFMYELSMSFYKEFKLKGRR